MRSIYYDDTLVYTMIKSIHSFFRTYILQPEQNDGGAGKEQALRLATAALFMEIARADFDISQHERTRVLNLLREHFDLDKKQAEALAELGEQKINEHSSLHPFTRLINDAFSADEKQAIVEHLWRIAYADKDLHKYEEHLVRRISDLLYVPHNQMIRAKHRVLDEIGS